LIYLGGGAVVDPGALLFIIGGDVPLVDWFLWGKFAVVISGKGCLAEVLVIIDLFSSSQFVIITLDYQV
jgi:hypothetical protein